MGTKSCGSRKTGSGPSSANHPCVPGYWALPLRPALLTWEMDISLQLFHKVMVKIGTQLFNRCYLIPLLSSYVHPHTMIRPGSWEPTGVPGACNLVPPRKGVPMRPGAKASPFLSQALPPGTAPHPAPRPGLPTFRLLSGCDCTVAGPDPSELPGDSERPWRDHNLVSSCGGFHASKVLHSRGYAFVPVRLGQLPGACFTEAPGSLYIHSNPPGCSYLRKTKCLCPAGRSERDPGSAPLGRGAAYLKHLTQRQPDGG